MKRIIKVCGMTQADNIEQVDLLHPDLMGFIFYAPSPRCCKALPEKMPIHAKRVGVFVDAPAEVVVQKAQSFGLHYLQLHGHESAAYCKLLRQALGLPIIKAFQVGSVADLELTSAYSACCDLFIFDTASPGMGGSGRQFDWSILSHYHGSVPFLLSGGIGPDSAEALQHFHHPQLVGYDINSRFEVAPGIKNIQLINQFINNISL